MVRIFLIMSLVFQASFIKAQLSDTVLIKESKGVHLAQIAWENSPFNMIHSSNVDVARAELRSSKLTWLNGLSVGSNLNEFTINPPPERSAFFPRYYVSFGLNFGQAFGTSKEVKKAKNQIMKLGINRAQDSLKLRSEVLRRYQVFKMTEELLKISKENIISINSELTVVEQAYSDGTTDLVTYTLVMRQYSDAKFTVIKANNDYAIAKINLEELLGISLEDTFNSLEKL